MVFIELVTHWGQSDIYISLYTTMAGIVYAFQVLTIGFMIILHMTGHVSVGSTCMCVQNFNDLSVSRNKSCAKMWHILKSLTHMYD